MKATMGWAALCLLLAAEASGAVEAMAVFRPPAIDGDLREWGAPRRISIAAGAPGVGLRGAIGGWQDHEADLYLMWDADFLYAALVVVDDVADVARIGADEHVWQGPAGERKDKMFYYDHLKVFLRGPEQPLGYNAWFAPSDGEQGPYKWGGRQRSPASADIPVRLASAWRPGVYSYELAIPWSWLELTPQPGMEVEGLFLLPDADRPGAEVYDRVAAGDKWVWWQGGIRLEGEPPGLAPPPPPPISEQIEKAKEAIVVPPVAQKAEPEPGAVRAAPGAGSAPAKEASAPARARAAAGSVAESAEVVEVEPTVSEAAALRARLNRQLLARESRPQAPPWVHQVGARAEVSEGQADSLFHRLKINLHRLADSRINSRTDGLVMDMAEYAGIWRLQARDFMQGLLGEVLERLRQGDSPQRAGLEKAAVEAGVEGERAARLVEELCARALAAYAGDEVTTTEELLQKARARARLSSDEARALVAALVRDWAE